MRHSRCGLAQPVGLRVRDLLQKSRWRVGCGAAEEQTLARVGQRQLFLRPRHGDVAKAALLLQLLLVALGACAGEDPLLHAHDVHALILQALGAVHRHHRDAVVLRRAVEVGIERDLVEKARERGVFRISVQKAEDVGFELLHVLKPPAALHIHLLLQRAHIAALLADQIVKVRQFRFLRRLAQRVDHLSELLQLLSPVFEHSVIPRLAQHCHHRHALLLREHLHALNAGISDAAGRGVDDAAQAQIVRRVVDHGQIREHVLDLRALEELHAANDLIGHAVALEGVFQRVGLGIHAVEDRVVPPVPAAVVVHHDGGDNEVRLVRLVEHGFDRHLVAVAPVGPERLSLAAGVVADHRVGRVQDVGGGAVVLLQPDRARAAVLLFKIEDV